MGLIITALTAFAGFLIFFHAFAAAVSFTCIPSAPNLYLVSPEMDALINLACLSVAWVLGFFQKGMFSFRYIGTRFYGHEQVEQGYVATKWLTVVFPLLPIRSYLVTYPIQDVSRFEFEYQRTAVQPIEGYFHWPQMLRTALISYGTILWCLGCLWLMFNSSCF